MDNNFIEYTTVQGDTYDLIALRAYESEFKSHLLIQANPNYSDVIKFGEGIVLKVPVISRKDVEVLPPWKR